MKRVPIADIKAAIDFRQGELPSIDPGNPTFTLVLGDVEIQTRVKPKAARRLAAQPGAAVLQGKLVAEGSKLNLLDAGFQWFVGGGQLDMINVEKKLQEALFFLNKMKDRARKAFGD